MRPRLAVAGLAFAAAIASAGAATTLKPVRADGFNLSVPSNWQVLKNVGTVKLYAISPKVDNSFRVNANVVVTPSQSGPPTSWRSAMIRELAKGGIKVSSLSTRDVRLPGGNAVELRYRGTMLGRRLQWLAYVFQGPARTHVLTFTSAEQSYTRYAPLFRTMARSFRIG
jgi:hypothetical protein